jgi:hypothetical protein
MIILYEPEISTAGHYEPEIPTADHYEITASHYEFKNRASLRGPISRLLIQIIGGAFSAK